MSLEEIDVIKLYAGKIPNFEDHRGWNAWLTKCFDNDSFDELIKARRGIQIGMATAVKKKLVNDAIAAAFCRWTGSIEKTIRKIVQKRNTLANDVINNKFTTSKTLNDKRQRDADLEVYLRKMSY